MKNAMYINQLRWKLCRNFLYEAVKKTPLLMSLIIIIPFILFILSELMIGPDIAIYALNPDIHALFHSFPVFFHRLLYYSLLLITPLYMLLSQYNVKSYLRYKTMNISFKEITIANMLFTVFLMNLFFVISMILILSKTASSLLSCLVFIAIFSFSICMITMSIFLFYQISVNFFRGIIKTGNTMLYELIIVLCISFILIYPVAHMPISFYIRIPSIMIILFLLLAFFSITIIYNKIKINSSYILHRTLFNKENAIWTKHDISEVSNFSLMLYHMKNIFLEYIFTIVFFIFLLSMINQLELLKPLFLQLLLPLFLISNGAIYSYHDWYDLRFKQIFHHILTMDFLFSTISMLLIVSLSFYLLYAAIPVTKLLLATFTYFIIVLLQRKLKLIFVNDSKSPILFILVYGTISYAVITLLERIFTLVS